MPLTGSKRKRALADLIVVSRVEKKEGCLFCSQEFLPDSPKIAGPSESQFIHPECVSYSSRRKHETEKKMINRITRRKLKCRHCKQPRASLGCHLKSCHNVYHIPCAKLSGAEYADYRLFCKDHISLGIEESKRWGNWPSELGIEYSRMSSWKNISLEDQALLAENSGKWENLPVEWFNYDLISKIRVKEIFHGHWAWCKELHSLGNRQFEAVANQEILAHDFIAEYTGRVRYQHESLQSSSKYIANYWYPEDLPPSLYQRSLCLDSLDFGNETRFINSVTSSTPPEIKQNATMTTVWCQGKLRIVITSLDVIPEGAAIVVNYNEVVDSYFVDDN